MNMSPIKLESVSFSYDGERVLEDISLEVHQGDFLGVIGPNGSGKTTLLKIMLGLLKPQAGQVYLFGEPPDHFRQWSRIGYVPQKATQTEILFPITVNGIVSMGRATAAGLFHRLSKRDRQAVSDALAMTEMGTFSGRRFNELSGGQQQRVYIARALASQPDILFLDEPATGVDVEAQARFYRLLSQLNKQQGLTLIMVSHDIGTVVSEVNRIACINRRLIFLGPPQTFLKGDYMEKLYGPSRKPITHRHGLP